MKDRVESHSVAQSAKRLKQEMKCFERMAIAFFIECPKFLTLVRHADQAETTMLHCYKRGKKPVDFGVPKQEVKIQTTSDGIPFSAVSVLTEDGEKRWLIVNIANRQGFLLPGYVFNEFHHPVRLRRGYPGKIAH